MEVRVASLSIENQVFKAAIEQEKQRLEGLDRYASDYYTLIADAERVEADIKAAQSAEMDADNLSMEQVSKDLEEEVRALEKSIKELKNVLETLPRSEDFERRRKAKEAEAPPFDWDSLASEATKRRKR